jgi:O-antigen/teichoic acid export membrane protein
MLNQLKRLLPKSQFSRGVGVLVGGTASAQLVMVLTAPLLTRLYSPEDFGLLAVYSGLLALFAVVASLRYQLAIPLPSCDQEAVNIVVLSLVCVLATTLVSSLLVFFVGDSLARLLDAPQLASYLWLLPVGVFLMGLYQIFNYWALRIKNYKRIATARIKQSLTTLIVQVIGYKFGEVALIAGQACGHGMGCYSLAKSAIVRPEFKQWQWSAVWAAAKRYRKFPYFSTWDGLFNTAGVQLPPLLFAALFSPSAAGLYALAHRVLAIPMSIIGDAVGKVFFANAAEAHREGVLGALVINVHKKLAVLAMPPALILIVAGPQLFALVFGAQWQQAGEFSRWLAPWLYLVFITSPLTPLFAIMEKQRQGLFFQALLLVLRIAAILAGAWYGNLVLTVALFSLVSVLCWVGFLVWMAFNTGNTISSIVHPTVKILIISGICVFPLWLGIYIENFQSSWLILCFITSAMIATMYLKYFREVFR